MMRTEFAAAQIVDQAERWTLLGRSDVYDARVFTHREDTIQTPDGEHLVRSYLHHPGAVAVIAVDARDRVAVLRQYRHPVGMKMVEPPAGLLDVDGEDVLAAAQRELAEEAQLEAKNWQVLVDICATPGSSQEGIRIFLATDLALAPVPEGFVVEHEEAHMELGWVPFADLVEAVLAGRVTSPSLVSGTLALQAARTTCGEASLRSAEADWFARSCKEAQDAHVV